MKLADCNAESGKIKSMDLKIIYDQFKIEKKWDKQIKTVVVADADSLPGSETALMDLYNEDIEKFKFKDTLRAINCFYKTVTTKRGVQKLITPGFYKDQQVGRFEKIGP